MHENLSPFQILLIVFAGIFLVIANMDSMWSGSADLAHHYALSFRIYENWSLTTAYDPSLGVMNFYPKISHTLAAVAGHIFNSPFLGIQLISLLALALLWGAVIFILNTLPLRVAYISSVGLVCLLTANSGYLNFEIHGDELVGNFFFSQLVAQSVVIFAIAIAIYLELKKYSDYAIVFFLIVIIFIVTGIHLLPALELLGVFFGVVAINNYMLLSGHRHQRLKIHLCYLATIIAVAGSVLLSPTFMAMNKASRNNGTLNLTNISSTAELILVCILVLTTSGLLLILWNKNKYDDKFGYIATKYLGLYGGSIALLCLTQIAFLNFGYGSDYATKKYAFGLFTFLFISIPVLVGCLLKNIPIGKFFDELLRKDYLRSAVMLFTFSAAFLFPIPQTKTLDTSDIVSLERQLINLRAVAVPTSIDKSNVVIGLKNMYNTINYMFSIAIMKTPMLIATPDVLLSNTLNDLNNYNTIFTSVDLKPYYQSECTTSSFSGSIALIDAICVGEVFINSSVCNGDFDFSSRGWFAPSIIRGFSHSWEEGRWTVGRNANFTCTITGKVPSKVKIHATPFVYGSHDIQRLRVTIKSNVTEYIFNNAEGGRSVEIALPSYKDGEKITIDFEMPDAISPKQVGYNEDVRPLGVNIRTIIFEYE